MRYASFKCGPWGKPDGLSGVLVGALTLVLPVGNPDFLKTYQEVVTWWFEIDEETNIVVREIAFDVGGRAVAASPLGENEGIFTDLDSAPNGVEAGVDPNSFEEKWNEARDKWFEARYARPAR